jgi:hypothetical protein
VNRRAFLAGMTASLVASRAHAFGETTRLGVAELDLGPGTLSRPAAWKRLLYELGDTTSVEVGGEVVRHGLEDDALFEHPFSVLLGDGAFAPPTDVAVERLSRYLAYGGVLLVDDATGAEDSPFYAATTDLLTRIYPTRPSAPLAADHSVFRSFFLLSHPVGRVDRFKWLEGVTVGTSTPVILMRNDLSGALDRGPDGRERQACVPGGEDQRREAIKLGINVVMYALTADYKRDMAHTRALMREGRIE